MRFRSLFLFPALLVCVLGVAGPRHALAFPASRQAGEKMPEVKFTDYRLANGLRVILAPDHAAPVIAVSVTYNVGSRNERSGRTGFAHLFEHLMFQGSANVGKGEHILLIDENGGTMNGTTNQDRTNYFEELPDNQLDLALYLEADRMRSLDISQQNLDNQRQVVQEERRLRVDNVPYGAVYEKLLGLAYHDFPYQHSTIGSMADLNAATLEDVRAFHAMYYAPNNAVLAVAGEFDPAHARRVIEQDFGSIPRGPEPPPVTVNEPPPSGERRATVQDPLARAPRYTAAYVTVPGNSPDFQPLNLLGNILASGRSSRLYRALVEKRIAVSVDAGEDESRGPGLFEVEATVPPGGDLAKAESVVDAEIARIQADGVTDEELRAAKNRERVAILSRLQTALGRANLLSQYAVFYNDPSRINTRLTSIAAVTPDDVRRVAQKYLTSANRVVVLDEPTRAPSAGAPGPRTGAAPAAGGAR